LLCGLLEGKSSSSVSLNKDKNGRLCQTKNLKYFVKTGRNLISGKARFLLLEKERLSCYTSEQLKQSRSASLASAQ
jgi:hypothetical protein